MYTYNLHLSESEMRILMRALIGACCYETEYLGYYDHCEDTQNEPGICGLRNNVSDYLSLRHTLRERMEIAEGNESPPVSDPADTDFWMVVDGWNKEIKRVHGEPHEG